VQTALKMVIEPIFETQFRPGSYGFRPGRGGKSLPSRKRGTRCGKSTGC
jgi:retron-type reverse transcriptase